jgi:hypothetical protein
MTYIVSAEEGADPVTVRVYENKPLTFTDTNGTTKGVYADILNYIAEKEGWEIEHVSCE